MSNVAKPKLLFLRFSRPNIPSFLKRHLEEQVLCLSQYFDVIVNNDYSCDYKQLCETHEPDIAMFESGVWVGQRNVSNVSSFPTIPKIGFINCDAYCPTRKIAIYDMARWEISTFFGISVSLASYTPSIADRLFVWPNFVNPEMYRDYRFPKVVPILFSGSQASHYPWRSKIDRIVSQRYPSLHSPHFGWSSGKGKPSASSFMEGEKYAQLINSAWVAPSCGTIANEVVRKHFEIPACNTCLLAQKTPGLVAAGFVDLVNCVFADEVDVLDKLEWLFQRPDELDRIIKAGKQLVDSHHTIRQRDQIFQWYTLNKQLKHGQKIVQPGPFMPLTIQEENNGVTNGHVNSRGVDRLLMRQADEQLRSGRYNDAENLYRRCLNYHQPDIPEARFRLVLCLLSKGDSKAALAIVRTNFPSHRLDSRKGFEPDPTEWAWFIVVLMCCGKNREAALRADQFNTLHNEELHRVRCIVRMLCGQKSEILSNISRTAHRASVHHAPELTIEVWLENVRRILEACGQIRTASVIARASSWSQLLEVKDFSNKESQGSIAVAGRPRKNHTFVDKPLAPVANHGSFGNVVLRNYLAVGSRVSRLAQKGRPRLKRLMGRIGAYIPFRSASIAEDECAGIVRLLQKEDIKSGVLIGAANGSWLADAFMRGMQGNPNTPSAVCVNYDTLELRRFHARFADAANVQFRYVPNEGGCFFESNENSHVMAICFSDKLQVTRFTTVRATLVLLDRTNDRAGSEFFRAMLSDENYYLVVHEPSHIDGYAVFRRVAVKAGCPSPITLHKAG
jgi:hypothetical protein